METGLERLFLLTLHARVDLLDVLRVPCSIILAVSRQFLKLRFLASDCLHQLCSL